MVPSWLIIISLVFFYLYKVLFSGFLQFNGNFVDAQNNSKYRDCPPLKHPIVFSLKREVEAQSKFCQLAKCLRTSAPAFL